MHQSIVTILEPPGFVTVEWFENGQTKGKEVGYIRIRTYLFYPKIDNAICCGDPDFHKLKGEHQHGRGVLGYVFLDTNAVDVNKVLPQQLQQFLRLLCSAGQVLFLFNAATVNSAKQINRVTGWIS